MVIIGFTTVQFNNACSFYLSVLTNRITYLLIGTDILCYTDPCGSKPAAVYPEGKMEKGIDRSAMAREVRDLTNANLVTMHKSEARKLLDFIPDWADDLATAIDEAQGADQETDRYVVVYVEKE
jgi:RAB protein geranylgeranyltransferase component A